MSLVNNELDVQVRNVVSYPLCLAIKDIRIGLEMKLRVCESDYVKVIRRLKLFACLYHSG
jgi:hypothetical protein